MKKSSKIIIFVCGILAAIAIIIVFTIMSRNDNKGKTEVSKNTIQNDNLNIISNTSTARTYINIKYETTSKVYEIAGTKHTITVNQDFPTIIASDESVKNIMQGVLDKIANDEFSDFKKQVEDRINDKYGIDAEFMEYVGDLSLSWKFVNSRNDDKVVSVKNESEGDLGGVSWSSKRGYSFSSKTGQLLKIEDIAIHEKALKKYLNETIVKYLKTNSQDLGLNQEIMNDIDKYVNIDELTWYFSDSGLTVCFEKYNFSVDTFDYTIEYSKLDGYVKPEYLK